MRKTRESPERTQGLVKLGALLTLVVLIFWSLFGAKKVYGAGVAAHGTTLCNTEGSQADFERFLGYVPRRAAEIDSLEAIREKHRLDQVARGHNYAGVQSLAQKRTVDGREEQEVCVSFNEKKPHLGTPAIVHFHVALADMLVAAAEARGNQNALAAMRKSSISSQLLLSRPSDLQYTSYPSVAQATEGYVFLKNPMPSSRQQPYSL